MGLSDDEKRVYDLVVGGSCSVDEEDDGMDFFVFCSSFRESVLVA